MNIEKNDLIDLESAVQKLENEALVIKLSNYIGACIKIIPNPLPKKVNAAIGKITQKSLNHAVDAAIFTMQDLPGKESSNVWHKVGVAATGGVGGFFGFSALAIELPISTAVMLRSIADIARSEGEIINNKETKLACMEVFAFGDLNKNNKLNHNYYDVRASLVKSLSSTAKYIAKKGLSKRGAPKLLQFIIKISERFSIQVSQKVAAQSIPFIGAAGGAAINALFIDHFQKMAQGHFTIRRLERKYGEEIIKEKYNQLTK